MSFISYEIISRELMRGLAEWDSIWSSIAKSSDKLKARHTAHYIGV